jgi:hypothetical protein
VNTKVDEGRCQKVHSDTLKADFQKSKNPFMFDSLIEREFNMRISEADKVIKVFELFFYFYPHSHQPQTYFRTPGTSQLNSQRARARVEEEKTDETINPEINPDILRIHAEISRILSVAEAAGVEGDIDTVQVISSSFNYRMLPLPPIIYYLNGYLIAEVGFRKFGSATKRKSRGAEQNHGDKEVSPRR